MLIQPHVLELSVNCSVLFKQYCIQTCSHTNISAHCGNVCKTQTHISNPYIKAVCTISSTDIRNVSQKLWVYQGLVSERSYSNTLTSNTGSDLPSRDYLSYLIICHTWLFVILDYYTNNMEHWKNTYHYCCLVL